MKVYQLTSKRSNFNVKRENLINIMIEFANKT